MRTIKIYNDLGLVAEATCKEITMITEESSYHLFDENKDIIAVVPKHYAIINATNEIKNDVSIEYNDFGYKKNYTE